MSQWGNTYQTTELRQLVIMYDATCFCVDVDCEIPLIYSNTHINIVGMTVDIVTKDKM